ncbi:doubled motif LPXTG anchor domain-containing protein, partial [Oscillospiraceae bacterium PP1C4]
VPKPDETVVPKPDETVVPKPAETVVPKPDETVVPKPAETTDPVLTAEQKLELYNALTKLKDDVTGYKDDLRDEATDLLGKANLKALNSADQDILVNQYELFLLNPDEHTNPFASEMMAAASVSLLAVAPTAAPTRPEDATEANPFVGASFKFNPEYTYIVNIYYTRTTPSNPSDDDDDDDDNTTTILNPRVPLAKAPKNLVTILDPEVPLGNLPKTGGSAETATGKVGVLSLVLGALLMVLGKGKRKIDE